MTKVHIQAYAIDFEGADYNTKGLPPGVKLSHTFGSSPIFDWNCFGRGKDCISDATPLSSGAGEIFEQWAGYIYGDYSGTRFQDQEHDAAGIYVRVNGVCHNAANRILVLAGADVSDATGDALVLLLYGKYGYDIEEYIQTVRNAAQRVNDEVGTIVITPEQVNTVVQRITGDIGDEFDNLEKEMLQQHFMERLHDQNISSEKVVSVKELYKKFQEKRRAIYLNIKQENPDRETFQSRFTSAMKPELMSFLSGAMETLGESQYLSLFEAHPADAVQFLLG
jgi:hypothetical protein